ncbi:FAD binding domain-containing protein [uncultured Aureimonas sp.]|uniref:FAD binding domain-containing protein n=1 Tax=uncultured Aureimonas sp. TaxID=1604662 RepID=UPI0025EBE492|nr:FAD binding domain-containing protein [uncultured Aureimonas sp.]
MKPAPFDFVRAATLAEALDALAQAGEDGRVLAGGQSFVPMLNMRLARPSVLIDIMGVADLRGLDVAKGALRIGAGVRQVELARWPDLTTRLPLLAAAVPYIGHVQTRSRGTVCGSLAHADPSAELPLALIALEGDIHLRTKKARRTIAARDFFLGMMATALQPGEMIEAVSFPLRRAGQGFGFREVARRHGDYAVVACAAVAGPQGIRLAVGGVGDVPTLRELPDPASGDLDEALNDFAWSLDAREDLHATPRYRRELVRRLGRDAIEEALRCRS